MPNQREVITSIIAIGAAGAAIYGITKGVQNGTFKRLPQTVSNAFNKPQVQQLMQPVQNMMNSQNVHQFMEPIEQMVGNENKQQTSSQQKDMETASFNLQ